MSWISVWIAFIIQDAVGSVWGKSSVFEQGLEWYSLTLVFLGK